jgi:hypothetical protein
MNWASFLRMLFVVLVIVGLSVLLFWAPWITEGYAEDAVVRNFEAGWEEVADG